MAVFASSALRNNLLQGSSLKESLDNGFVYVYAGTVPVDADAALDMVTVHTQLAKISADTVAVDEGVVGVRFATAASLGALAKDAAQTWAARINFVGKDAAAAGVSPLTATFFRFVGSSGTAGISAPVQAAGSTSATGGTIAAGTNFYVITALTALGETARSNEISIVSTGATSSNTINWAAVIGATSYRVYRGTVAGTHGTYYTVAAGLVTLLDTNAAGTAASSPIRDNGQPVGSTATARLQGSVATSGGDINLSSVALSDNGANTTGLSTFEVRMPSS